MLVNKNKYRPLDISQIVIYGMTFEVEENPGAVVYQGEYLHGLYQPETGRIKISSTDIDGEKLSHDHKVRTLMHEIGHAILQSDYPPDLKEAGSPDDIEEKWCNWFGEMTHILLSDNPALFKLFQK